MSSYFINQQGQRVDIICTALTDIEVVSLSIDESTNYDLFAVRGRTLSLTWLTGDSTLYYNSLRGTAISVKVDNVTIFDGVISTTPSQQPYNYKLERYTIYADDSLTATKYLSYATQEETLSSVFATYLQGYTYTQCVDVPLLTTRITLEMLTDTTTTVWELLAELAKLLNIEITSRDKRAGSAVVGTAVAVTPQRATTQLGVLDAIHAAEVEIQEESTGDGGIIPAEETELQMTWGALVKDIAQISSGYVDDNNAWVQPNEGLMDATLTGLDVNNKYDSETGKITNKVHNARFECYQKVAQYYRLGQTDGVTYLANQCYEIQMAVDYQSVPPLGFAEIPEGAPAFQQRTLIYPTDLNIGSTNIDGSASVEATFADLDLEQVYFTKRYSVTVPAKTTYKPKTYLLINGDVKLYPWQRRDGLISFNNQSRLTMHRSEFEQMHIKVRYYHGTTLLYTHDLTVWLSGSDKDALNVQVQNNVTWNTGLTASGFAVGVPSEAETCDNIEVDFLGIGGWRGILANNEYNPTPDNPSNADWMYATLPGTFRCYQIAVKAYSVNLSFEFASGYLEDTPPTDIDTTPTATGDEERTSYFYWNQDSGIDEVTYSNLFNSLVEVAGKNTVKVGDGYLGKVTSSLYQGSHYVEEYQLATIIDNRSTSASVVRLTLDSLERIITYNSVKYRLVGCSHNLVTGLYDCSYIEVKACTTIEN